MKSDKRSWNWQRVRNHIRDALYRLSWLRTSPQKTFHIRAVVRPVLGGEFRAETHDISATGAFISLEKVDWSNDEYRCRQNIKIGTRCMVRLMIDQFHVVHVNAEVVRAASRTATHPEGFALRFICLEPEERRILSELNQRFEPTAA